MHATLISKLVFRIIASRIVKQRNAQSRLDRDDLRQLPGAEVVLAGIADLQAGRSSVNASAVQSAATRLRRLGLDAPGPDGGDLPSHRLYAQLSAELGDAAYARYNAILSRVASFAGSAERARNS
jgi:hypothetical protein